MLNKNISLLLSTTCLTVSFLTQTLLTSNINACDRYQEDLLEQKSSFKKEEFFNQKYSFSTPILDVPKLSRSLLLAKDEQERSSFVLIFEEESKKGNAEAQERLYSYYSNPLFERLNLINPIKASALLNLGKDQNKGWAYWEFAEKNKRSTTEVMTEHYLASNLSYLKAIKYLEKNDCDDWSSTIKRLVPESHKNKKIPFSKAKQQNIEVFICKYIQKQYALPLVFLHKEMAKFGYSITYNSLYWTIIKSAADLGNIESMMMYGGEMQKQNNIPIAFEYCKKAADLGDSNALSNAGLLLKQGFEGQKPDKKSAFKLFSQSADLGNFIAMSNVALLLIDGFDGQKSNKRLALLYLYEAAKSGDAEDLFNLALLLEQGFEGQKPDKVLALQYYLKAADLGNSKAMFNVAFLYYYGFQGQNPDLALALKYFLKAADLGNSIAMYNVAILMKHGVDGQKLDKACALEYFQQAANRNLVPAMVQLAILYLESYELNMISQENLDSALFWLEKASALGDKQAPYYLNKAQTYLIDYQLNAKNQKDRQLEQFLQKTENILIQESQPLVQYHEVKLDLNEDKELKINISENTTKPNIDSSLPFKEVISLNDIPKDEITLIEGKKEEIWTLENQSLFKTDRVKSIQKNLRQIAFIKKEREASQNTTQTLKLSPKASEIAMVIKSGESKNINFNNLRNLFKDPAFQNQIEIRNTKSGILVSAHNRMNNQHATAGNHVKHTKHYKGIQPAFIKELGFLLKIFPDLY